MRRFVAEYGLTGEMASMLTGEKALADYFEEAVETGGEPLALAKWIAGDLVRAAQGSRRADRSGARWSRGGWASSWPLSSGK